LVIGEVEDCEAGCGFGIIIHATLQSLRLPTEANDSGVVGGAIGCWHT
jgi:hypothetical protein